MEGRKRKRRLRRKPALEKVVKYRWCHQMEQQLPQRHCLQRIGVRAETLLQKLLPQRLGRNPTNSLSYRPPCLTQTPTMSSWDEFGTSSSMRRLNRRETEKGSIATESCRLTISSTPIVSASRFGARPGASLRFRPPFSYRQQPLVKLKLQQPFRFIWPDRR